MRARVPMCLVVLALAGCAGTAAPPRDEAPDALTPDVLAKIGAHHVPDLYPVIGTPAASEKTAQGTRYTWHADVHETTFVPTAAPVAGFIGQPPTGAEGTGGGGGEVGHEVTCRVRIDAGSTDLIEHLDFNGPRRACGPVTQRLAAWIRAVG
ncbi:MAG: hypothetical protein ACTHL8_04685 [Burkholderiaceae bacterium]